MESVKKSLFFSFSQKYSEIFIGFLSTLILARLLTPEEVGIYSVIATLTVIAHTVRDFGVSNYIVQEQDLTDEKVFSAFLVTFFWSYSIGFSMYLFAHSISAFFERPELVSVVYMSSFGFALIPFGSVSLNLLRKDMQFKKLYFINVTSVIISSITAIVLALLNFSYMSLAWGSLAGIATTVIFSSFFRRKIEISIPSFHIVKLVFLFGTKSSYISILTMTVSQLPEILIAKLHGMTNVGLYSRANGLVKIFNMGVLRGIFPVLLPHLVNKLKNGGDIKHDFLLTIELIATLSWPFFIFLSFFSSEIIILLFGVQWSAASEILYFLCVAAAIASIYSFNSQILISQGLINLDVKTQSYSQLISIILLISLSFYGFNYILIALVISRLATLLISFYFCLKSQKIMLRIVLSSFTKPLLVSLCCIASLEVYYSIFSSYLGGFSYLIVGGGIYTAVWLASIYFLRSKMFSLIIGFLPIKGT